MPVVSFLSPLGRFLGLRREPKEPPKVNYKDFDDFVHKCFVDVMDEGQSSDEPRMSDMVDENGGPVQFRGTFSGTIENSKLAGRHLEAVVIRGRDDKRREFTLVLTGIVYPKDLSKTVREQGYGLEATGNYKLTKDDLPASKQEVDGFHLLVSSESDTGAIVLNTNNKDLAVKVLDHIADEYAQGNFGLQPLRHAMSQGEFSSASGGVDRGPLIL